MQTYMLHFAFSLFLQKSGVQVGAHSARKVDSEICNNLGQRAKLSTSILHIHALTTAILLTAQESFKIILVSSTATIDKVFTLFAGSVIEVA